MIAPLIALPLLVAASEPSPSAPATTANATTSATTSPTSPTTNATDDAAMQVRIDGVVDGGEIPIAMTCEGSDTAPAVVFEHVPARARSLVWIVADPDAPDPAHPRVTWTHEVLFDLPVTTTGLPAARTKTDVPEGAHAGLNDWKVTGWRGPCPPIGRHRYRFTLYAVDTTLAVRLGNKPATRANLLHAMKGHVVAETTVTGTYVKHATPAPGSP